MSYSQGSTIQDDHYNYFVTLLNELYADIAQGNLNLGTGDYGYGQSPLPTVNVGDTITAAQWTALFSAMEACGIHQDTPLQNVPPSVAAGQTIRAISGPGGVEDVLINLRTNRLSISPGQAAITSNGTKISESRTLEWTETVTHIFDVQFSSTDQARYFFNAGGEIHWSGEYIPGTPDESAEESSWQANIMDIGTLRFNATTSQADAGTVTNLGYYELTTAYQTLLVKGIITSGQFNQYYVSEEIRVEVRSENAARDRIRFRVSFVSDPAANRVLNGTLNSFVDQKRSIGTITTTEPSYSTISFSGS